jgi:hypothetical protein
VPRYEGTQALALSLILLAIAPLSANKGSTRTARAGFLAFVLTLGSIWCAFQFGAYLKPEPSTSYYR